MPRATALALDAAAVAVPYHFRCPISLELMRDPVTVCTGQTYDRSSIESWVATGNTTCPVTRVDLTDFTLIPNHTLRRLIQEWCVANRAFGVDRIPTPKQPADPTAVRSILISAASGTSTSRAAALRRLRSLARESDKNRSVIVGDGNVLCIIEIAFQNCNDASDLDQELVSAEAMAVLSVLPFGDVDTAAIVSRPERLQKLGDIVNSSPSIEARVNAAAVIDAVAAGARSAEIRTAIGATPGVIDGLVALIGQQRSGRAARIGIRGLLSLCIAKENRALAVASGAAAAVVQRIGELGAPGDAERALALIELLCRMEGGTEAVVAGWGGGMAAVAALVRYMDGKLLDRAAEHAAGALVAVVGSSEELQKAAVAAGVVPYLLLMVQGGCSERAKRKAQILLKLLRSSLLQHHSIANSCDFIQAF